MKTLMMTLAALFMMTATSFAQDAVPATKLMSKSEIDAKLAPFFQKLQAIPEDGNENEALKKMSLDFVKENPNEAGVYVISNLLAHVLPTQELLNLVDSNDFFKKSEQIQEAKKNWLVQLETAEGKMFKAGFSLASYQTVFSMLGRPIRNTFVYCFIAIVVIVIVSMLVAYAAVRKPNALTHFINGVTMVPYILPGAVLGLTLLISFNSKPLVLIGTSTIIIIALIIRRLPYTLRSATAIMYQLSPSVDEAAISLGCGPVRTFFKVTARLMLPGVFSGAILSWVTILNELSASFMLYNSKTITMSITVYQYVARTEYGTAAALASILTLTTIISLIIFYTVSGDKDMSL